MLDAHPLLPNSICPILFLELSLAITHHEKLCGTDSTLMFQSDFRGKNKLRILDRLHDTVYLLPSFCMEDVTVDL